MDVGNIEMDTDNIKLLFNTHTKAKQNNRKIGKKNDFLINCHFSMKRLKLKPIEGTNTYLNEKTEMKNSINI